jgi:hypothetical protein
MVTATITTTGMISFAMILMLFKARIEYRWPARIAAGGARPHDALIQAACL